MIFSLPEAKRILIDRVINHPGVASNLDKDPATGEVILHTGIYFWDDKTYHDEPKPSKEDDLHSKIFGD